MIRRLSFAVAALLCCSSKAPTQTVPDDNPHVENIARLLASDDADVRRAALQSLDSFCAMGTWGVPISLARWNAVDAQLLRLLEQDDDVEIALFAGLVMATGTPNRHAAHEHLVASLPAWRRLGADPQLCAALRTALANEADPQWIVALAEFAGPGPVQRHALAALTRLGPDAVPAAARLHTALEAAPMAERWRVALVLAAIGDTEPLRERLATDDARLRVCAALALVGADVPPPAAVQMALADDRATVRRQAIRGAARLAAVPQDVPRRIADCLDGHLQHHAQATLMAMGPKAASATKTLMAQLSLQETRPTAIECLGAIGPAAREAVPELVATALTDPWHPNSRAAGDALARIAPGEAVPLLARAFAADMAALRHELWPSAAALRGAGAATAPELALFVGALERPELPTRQNALYALVGLGPAAMPALPQILAQLDGTDSWSWSLVAECARAIGPPAASLAIPRFEQRFGVVAHHLRVQLVVDLHALGVTAEPLLVRASADADPMVRWKADEALLRMVGLSEVGAAHLVELLAKTEPKDPPQWFTRPTPWRHLERPLAELTVVPPTLARRLPELLDHPDEMAFHAIRSACVRALCPAAEDHVACMSLVLPLSRADLRRVLADQHALTEWLDRLADGEDAARAAAARSLRERLGATRR